MSAVEKCTYNLLCVICSMTSLARQLQSLQAFSVPVKLGSENRRKSLLWDPKDAATKDRETIYEIGISNDIECTFRFIL
jgi:U3 small nucleolar RNA-associated protein 10